MLFVLLGALVAVAMVSSSELPSSARFEREPVRPVVRSEAETRMMALEARFVSLLSEFVAIPSVSGEPGRRNDVDRAFEWLLHLAEQSGGATGIRKVTVAGVEHKFAKMSIGSADASVTVVVYGHLDVQPGVGWRGEAFSLRAAAGGRLMGRGVADDKGARDDALRGWGGVGGGSLREGCCERGGGTNISPPPPPPHQALC